jgi:hypothetical protein
MIDFYFTGVRSNTPIAEYLLDHEHGCLLLSQLNERKNIMDWIELLKNRSSNLKLFIDSGAFSAWTKGKVIDIEEYISFINTYKDYFTVCASVDTIPGKPRSSVLPTQEDIDHSAEQTWNNFLYMRSKMEDPDKLLYTFHIGEDIKFLTRALEYKDTGGPIKYIALGGLVGKPGYLIDDFCDRVFKLIRTHNRSDIKVHAFGMTRLNTLEEFPFTSCDSTSWLQHANYGAIAFGAKLISVSDRQITQDRNYANRNKAMQEEMVNQIENRGFTLEQLQSDLNARQFYNVKNFQEWSDAHKCRYYETTKEKKELW